MQNTRTINCCYNCLHCCNAELPDCSDIPYCIYELTEPDIQTMRNQIRDARIKEIEQHPDTRSADQKEYYLSIEYNDYEIYDYWLREVMHNRLTSYDNTCDNWEAQYPVMDIAPDCY